MGTTIPAITSPSAQNVSRPEKELPYLKDPEGVSLAVSLEPYLFLSASRPSNPVLSPML